MTVADLEVLGPGDSKVGPPVDPSGKKITGRSPTRIALDRLRRDKVAVVSTAIVGVLVLAGIFAPLISSALGLEADAPPSTPASQYLQFGYPKPEYGAPFGAFSWDHPLGLAPTTAYDNLARLLYGIRTSFAVALLATLFTTLIGISVGLVAGFARGALDKTISFVIDVFLSFPFLLGALAIAPIITSRFSNQPDLLEKAQFFSLISVLVIFGWMGLARLIRGQVLSLREREFVQAAQVIGVPTRRILFKELLPNLVAPIVVTVSLSLPGYVAAEAGLAYLGIGLTGVPSLGQTILRGTAYYSQYPLYLWAPVITVMLLVMALNLLGDSVRDAFDPSTRR
ncbi:MAG: ABC transporter permease [Propionibacteriales bacterium]|nr:ABC transporter permease [Propionibacteriales bacterium]